MPRSAPLARNPLPPLLLAMAQDATTPPRRGARRRARGVARWIRASSWERGSENQGSPLPTERASPRLAKDHFGIAGAAMDNQGQKEFISSQNPLHLPSIETLILRRVLEHP